MQRLKFHAQLKSADGGWDRTFEAALAELETLPRMFIELDGSFVWVTADEPRGQLDGNLFDRDDRLEYVEVRGECSRGEFERFLTAVGRPAGGWLFQLPREGRSLKADEFFQFAAADT